MTTLWRHVDAAIVGGGLPLGPALSAAAASFAARLCPGGALTLAHATLVPAADPGDDRAVTVTGTVDLPGAPAAAASLQVTGSAGAVQLALAIGPLPAGWQLSSIAPALPPSLTILDGVPTLAPSALAALALRGPSLALTAPDDDAALAAITAPAGADPGSVAVDRALLARLPTLAPALPDPAVLPLAGPVRIGAAAADGSLAVTVPARVPALALSLAPLATGATTIEWRTLPPPAPGAPARSEVVLAVAMTVGGVPVSLTTELDGTSGWLLRLVPGDDALSLGAGLTQLARLLHVDASRLALPPQLSPALDLHLIELAAVVRISPPALTALVVTVGSGATWPLPIPGVSIGGLALTWELDVAGGALSPGAATVAAALTLAPPRGSTAAPAVFDLWAEAPAYAVGARLRAGTELDLGAVLASLAGTAEVALPPELPALRLDAMFFAADPSSGAVDASAGLVVDWALPGAPAIEAAFGVAVSRTPTGDGGHALAGQVGVDARGPIPIVGGVSLDGLTLLFAWSEGAAWTVAGSVAATVFGHAVELAASYTDGAAGRELTLRATGDVELALAGVGSLRLSELSFRWARGGATGDAWAVSAAASLALDGLATIGGTLAIADDAGARSLTLTPTPGEDALTLALPLPGPAPELGLRLDSLAIAHDATAGWSIAASGGLTLTGLAEAVQRYLPARVDASLTVDHTGVAVSLPHLVGPLEIPLPTATLGSIAIPLGTAAVDVGALTARLGKRFAVSIELGIGLPAAINDVFGTRTVDGEAAPRHDVFVTYAAGDPSSTIRGRVAIDDAGLGLQLLTSPLRAVTFDVRGTDTWATIDLGPCGALELMVPSLAWTDGAFHARGGLRQVADRPLHVPLGGARALLSAHGLAALAALLPASVPLTGVRVYSPDTGLDVAGLERVLATMLGGAVPDAVRDGLATLAKVIERAPPRLLDYLNVVLPDELVGDLSVSAAGSVALSLTTGGPPIRLLVPAMGALGPALLGVELHGLSFGELLDGVLFQLTLDVVTDWFDLLPLLAALEPPPGVGVALAPASALGNRIIIHDLLVLIVYETEIPIPIPVFFGELGWEYHDALGFVVQAHLAFPEPVFSPGAALRVFAALERFLTVAEARLDPDLPLDGMDLALTLGPTYVGLPPWLGGRTLGTTTGLPAVSAWKVVASALDAAKFVSLPALIAAIPIADRGGTAAVTLGPLAADVTWLLATTTELAGGAWRQLGITEAEAAPLVALLPASPERGLAAFVHGTWAVAALGLSLDVRGAYLAAGGHGGVAGALAASGALGSLLSASLSWTAAVRPHDTPVVAAGGAISLVAEGSTIFTGTFAVADTTLTAAGELALFSSSAPLQIGGHGELALAADGTVSGSIDVHVAMAGATIESATAELGNHRLDVEGTWLGARVTCHATSRDGRLAMTGAVEDFTIPIDATTGPVVEPGSGLTASAGIHVTGTATLATTMTLDHDGFAAAVHVTLRWWTTRLELTVELDVSPPDLAALARAVAGAIRADATAVFHHAVAGMAAWLRAGTAGAATLAGGFAHAAAAARTWADDAWAAVGRWPVAAWQAAASWPPEAWTATQSWSASAWQATTAWPASAWRATAGWSHDVWKATSGWPTKLWSSSTSWTEAQWHDVASTAHHLLDIWHIDHAFVPRVDHPLIPHVDQHVPPHFDSHPHADTPSVHINRHLFGHHIDRHVPPHADHHFHADTPAVHVDTPEVAHVDTPSVAHIDTL